MSAFSVGYPKVLSLFFFFLVRNLQHTRWQNTISKSADVLGARHRVSNSIAFNLTGLILAPVDSWQVFWCSGRTSGSPRAPVVLGSRNTTTDMKMLSCKPMFLKRTLIWISQCVCVRLSLQTTVWVETLLIQCPPQSQHILHYGVDRWWLDEMQSVKQTLSNSWREPPWALTECRHREERKHKIPAIAGTHRHE